MTIRPAFERPRSRRQFVADLGRLGIAAGASGFLAACGSSGSSGSSDTISVLTWEGYLDPKRVKAYADEKGIDIRVTNAGSAADMYANVRANPARFDLIHNARDWFVPFVRAGLLAEFDESRVPNIKNIWPGYDWKTGTTVDGKLYGALYNWGDQPLGWNSKTVPGKYDVSKYMNSAGEIDDWNILWDPQFKGKVAIFDDPTAVQPMVGLALGFPDPWKLDEQQLDAMAKKLNELRPQVKRLTSGGASDQVAAFVSGEAEIGYINIQQVVVDSEKQGVPLKANHTVKQGVPSWADNSALTKAGADKADIVYDFINETMSVPWQAKLIGNTANSGILSLESATGPEAKAAGLTQQKLDLTLVPQTPGGAKLYKSLKLFSYSDDVQRRLDIWNEFKLGIGG